GALSGYYFVRIFFFFQAEDGIRDRTVTGVQTCALPISITYGIQSPVAFAIAPPAAGPATAPVAHAALISPNAMPCASPVCSAPRSEERRVGKECRSRGGREH